MADYKEYKPERIFQKADFPRIKREDLEKSAAEARKAQVGPAPKPVPQPISDPGLPVWSPDVVFNKVDFPSHTAPAPGAPARAKPSPVPGFGPGFEKRPEVVSKHAPPPPDGGPSAADRMFRQTVLGNAENAVYLIRHWYWEKPGKGPASPISGHDRIFIVLASLGQKAAGVLLDIMTPTERTQLAEILKQPGDFRPDQIAMVRRQFVESIRST